MHKLAAIALLLVGLAVTACSAVASTDVVSETVVIDAGQVLSWNLSEFDECEYVFEVRQTGGTDLDIKLFGQRSSYHQGTFKGRTLSLSNEHSLFEPKTVDAKITCHGG